MPLLILKHAKDHLAKIPCLKNLNIPSISCDLWGGCRFRAVNGKRVVFCWSGAVLHIGLLSDFTLISSLRIPSRVRWVTSLCVWSWLVGSLLAGLILPSFPYTSTSAVCGVLPAVCIFPLATYPLGYLDRPCACLNKKVRFAARLSSLTYPACEVTIHYTGKNKKTPINLQVAKGGSFLLPAYRPILPMYEVCPFTIPGCPLLRVLLCILRLNDCM